MAREHPMSMVRILFALCCSSALSLWPTVEAGGGTMGTYLRGNSNADVVDAAERKLGVRPFTYLENYNDQCEAYADFIRGKPNCSLP
eukprot:CAMPEP_0195097764 /NCGR_PEP_ID=MMETSP0448-20130528/54415_1 /TAXON_ID=66468 /ORGANISM="Heterocapsa triquestra, Strain CCMP 448" /LENGTH=86 /DNA_ID=CAMNT_0040132347 /DNA_START=24 /DNA_END=281 /DNA_ORIENTATION=+